MAHFHTSATLEPGDRFEVFRFDSTERLRLPKVLGPDGFPIERIEDPAGVPMEVVLDPSSRSVVVPKLTRVVPDPASTLWLEYQARGDTG